MNFCRRCGSKLSTTDNHVYVCKNKHTLYLNSAPAVSVAFMSPDNKIILSIRAHEPFKGGLDFIGGFVDGSESFEQALEREIKEETGLDPSDYGPFTYLTSAFGIYPFGGEDCPILSTFYTTRLLTDKPLIPSDDVAEIVTMSIDDIDPNDAGGDDIKTCLNLLKARSEEMKQQL